MAQVCHYGNQGFSRHKTPPTNTCYRFCNLKLKVVSLFQILLELPEQVTLIQTPNQKNGPALEFHYLHISYIYPLNISHIILLIDVSKKQVYLKQRCLDVDSGKKNNLHEQ